MLPAQRLAQTRSGSLGALLYHDSVPVDMFAESWPSGVRLQIHVSEADEWADLPTALAIATEVEGAEVFIYKGSAHLFAEPGALDHDPESAELLLGRTVDFLARL